MKAPTALLAATLTAAAAFTPSVALAQTRDRTQSRDAFVERVKTRCLAQIDRRQQVLVDMNSRLDKATNLADAHRNALQAIDDQASSGLAGLANTIQGEDNPQELRAECRQIVEDYRVFVLVRPRARLVVASDRELAAIAKLRDVADRVQSAIDKADADGKDTTQAKADLANMRTAIDTAAQHAAAVYDEVIHLAPADYNPAVLEPGRADTKAARDAIHAAAESGHAAVKDLRSDSSESSAT
jgi:hypothetical protein